ncbi:hypothetical protein VNO77_23384 [Canavalia gladiata]|uniref:Uncharacterized protein n=1 Tax=Canavalia gladiata TaxID=3824 RepID=A0AAN9L4E3_CANGL
MHAEGDPFWGEERIRKISLELPKVLRVSRGYLVLGEGIFHGLLISRLSPRAFSCITGSNWIWKRKSTELLISLARGSYRVTCGRSLKEHFDLLSTGRNLSFSFGVLGWELCYGSSFSWCHMVHFAYNSLWMGNFICPDWDVFQSIHPMLLSMQPFEPYLSRRPDDSTTVVGLARGTLSGIVPNTTIFPLELVRRRMQLEGVASRARVWSI